MDTRKLTSFATKGSVQQHARKAPQDRGMDTRKANKLRHEEVVTAACEEGPARRGDQVVIAAREKGPARPGDGYPENTNFATRKPTASSQHRRCRSVASASLSLPLPWVLVGLQTAGAGQIGRNLSHQPGSQAESLQETTDPGA